MPASVARTIEEKLTAALAPVRLLVEDQSAAHRGHAGAAGRAESHFRIEVVSGAFEGLNRLARERRVHDILAAELSDRVHALSVSARTPAEDQPNGPSGPASEKRKAEKAKRRA
jgi:BolA protein